MRRRDFLQRTGLVSASFLVPAFLKAMARGTGPAGGRPLVVVQLSGGNDGLNTIVPFRNDAYYKARHTLSIAPEKVVRITDELGLNPAMAPLRGLFDEGRMTVINGVGYPNPDRSHFRSMDIWHTASDSSEYLSTGWLGRYLDSECEHPHGVIEFGDRLSLANKGERMKAIAMKDPARFYAATREPYFAHLSGAAGEDHPPALGYLYKTMAETYESAAYIQATLKLKEPASTYPKGELASQLRTIARCIQSDLTTRVYYASTSGFDTHVNQTVKQARVLGQVADALAAFTADLQASGLMNDVLIMVFSEFGRRVQQNASGGTDHGTAGNLWLIGGALRTPGFYNEMPSLTDLDDNGDLKHSVDFRSVYATVIEDWLGVRDQRILDPEVKALPGLV